MMYTMVSEVIYKSEQVAEIKPRLHYDSQAFTTRHRMSGPARERRDTQALIVNDPFGGLRPEIGSAHLARV